MTAQERAGRRWRWDALPLRTKGLVVALLPAAPLLLFWVIVGLAVLRPNAPLNTAARGLEIRPDVAETLTAARAQTTAEAITARQAELVAARAELSRRNSRWLLAVLLVGFDRLHGGRDSGGGRAVTRPPAAGAGADGERGSARARRAARAPAWRVG